MLLYLNLDSIVNQYSCMPCSQCY